jgi:membrane protein YdbS with pleckstrin-like domain
MSESEDRPEGEATAPALPPVAPPPAPPAAPAPPLPTQWRPLPSEAATTAMYGGGGYGLLLGAGACFFIGWPLLTAANLLDLGWLQGLLAMTLLWLLLGAFGAFVAYRRWRATFWKLDDTGLHLRRGRMWRKEVLVPRSRVQHLDIERGPIERQYGLATLVVHTAGTRQHAMRIAGLPDADAVALRDALVPEAGRHDDVL